MTDIDARPTGQTDRSPAPQALALWRSYATSGDPRERDRLVLMFAPMVQYIVDRKAGDVLARRELEEVVEGGFQALIGSLDRYDPRAGTALEDFAWLRVLEGVLDRMRERQSASRTRRWNDVSDVT